MNDLMPKYIISGGHPLKGEIALSGSSSAAVHLLTLGLLTDGLLVLEGIPKTNEVLGMLEIIEFLGLLPIFDSQKKKVTSNPSSGVKLKAITPLLGSKSRFYPLVFGALLSRFGETIMPNPQNLGFHPIDRLLSALEMLGVTIIKEGDYITARNRPKSGTFHFDKNTTLGTATLILSSVLGNQIIRLENAAEEPEIDLLIYALVSMGAKIKREEPRLVVIEGVESLNGTLINNIVDRDLACFYASLAIMTKGEINLLGSEGDDLTAFLSKISALGGHYQNTRDGLRFWFSQNEILKPLEIETRPHPGFMSNWGPLIVPLLTQADGVSVLHETVFPQRFAYLPLIKNFGVEYQIFEPEGLDHAVFYSFEIEDDEKDYKHAVKFFGPTKIVSANINTEILDPELSLPLLILALTASGRSEIVASQILTDYDDLAGSLMSLGAKIETI